MSPAAAATIQKIDEAVARLRETANASYHRMRLKLSTQMRDTLRDIAPFIDRSHTMSDVDRYNGIPIEWVDGEPLAYFELRHEPRLGPVLDERGYPVEPKQLKIYES